VQASCIAWRSDSSGTCPAAVGGDGHRHAVRAPAAAATWSRAARTHPAAGPRSVLRAAIARTLSPRCSHGRPTGRRIPRPAPRRDRRLVGVRLTGRPRRA
jgi:hypothetical protein